MSDVTNIEATEEVVAEETTTEEVVRSEKFETVKRYYKKKTWDKSRVFDAVGRWITAEEYELITGEVYVEPEKVLTETEQMIAEAQDTQLIMMEAMADQYEESLERELNNMEVQATIYEELLAISEKL